MTKTNECLLKNLLDKDIRKMLFPLDMMLTIFFLSRYKISYNFITPNGWKNHIVSLMGTFLFVSFQMFHVMRPIINYGLRSDLIVVAMILNSIVHSTALNIYCIMNIVNCMSNVHFVLLLQRIYERSQKKERVDVSSFIYWNWMHIIGTMMSYVVIVIIYNLKIGFDISQIMFILSLMNFDLNIIYETFLMNFLNAEACAWKVEFVDSVKEMNALEMDWRNLFEAYVNLMKSYCVFKKLFRVQVLFQASYTFIGTLIYVQTLIGLAKSDLLSMRSLLMRLFVIGWVLKNLVLLKIMSNQLDMFYATVADIFVASTVVMHAAGLPKHIKFICKNIQRISRARFYKMTACGMFEVDGALPIKLANLVTTYVVVLLQMALR